MFPKGSREQKVLPTAETQSGIRPVQKCGNMNILLDEEGSNRKREVKFSPYVQEHIDLVTAIRTGKPINEAENTAMSTLVAIMGDFGLYRKRGTMDEMMNSELKLGPKVFAFRPGGCSQRGSHSREKLMYRDQKS